VHHPSASPTPRAPRGLGQLGVDALEHVVERLGVDQLRISAIVIAETAAS
jgi:hypothetical protein